MSGIEPGKTVTVIDNNTTVEYSVTPEEAKEFLAGLESEELKKRKNRNFMRCALRRLKRRR